jgi:DNA adenine methylase
VYDEPAIRSLSTLIANVIFTHAPFTQSMALAKKGDFMYLDPPYAPVDSKSFTGYTAAGFDADAHSTLFKTVAALRPAGVSALMSNADVELVKKAFPSPSYTTIIINCKRSIHSKDPAHRVNEVLIRN